MTQTPTRIEPSQWVAHFARLKDEGCTWFDFLAAIDRGDWTDVVARVVNRETGDSGLAVVGMTLALDSLTPLFPGAGWYEREAQEMFGVTFTGLADSRPLLQQQAASAIAALRKGSRS
ncbi:MAG: NADH-quinone oxidoreductase subunit C [Candidatus Nanopelagicales bacterium]